MVFKVLLGILFETEAPRKAVKYVGRQLIDCNGAGALADSGIVFEGVPEVLDLKREVLAAASKCVAPEAIIASTTSTILVDDISGAVEDPSPAVRLSLVVALEHIIRMGPVSLRKQWTLGRSSTSRRRWLRLLGRREEPLFERKQSLALWEYHQGLIRECDREIERSLESLPDRSGGVVLSTNLDCWKPRNGSQPHWNSITSTP